MSLLDHAILWHVYPLGATGAPIRDHAEAGTVHRLRLLVPWLDHVVELGCNSLLLGPIFASTSHGYDTLDHFRIDPRLGDNSDWDELVREASARGISIILDGVFNHVGVEHPLVREGSDLIRRENGHPRGWEGHGDLAELDHTHPGVEDLVVDVMTHWLDRGAAGWRLDVAYAVPSDFWSRVTGRVRAIHPEAVFIGEVIHGDYARIATEGGLDAVTQYELWKAIWSSIADRNLWELAHGLERHDAFAQTAGMQTSVGNHDVERIASRVGDDGAALAAVILMTLPGFPSVYYGDEQAFRGQKHEGFAADDAIRPPLPATPAELAPFGRWLEQLYRDAIGLRRRNPWITHARVAVTRTANTSLTYTVSGEGHVAEVSVSLEPTPRVEVRIDGRADLSWTR